MNQSKKYSLNWQDLAKGLLIAILTPVIVIIQQSIQAGSLTFNWQQLGMAAVGGLIAYLTKNFFTAPDLNTQSNNQQKP